MSPRHLLLPLLLLLTPAAGLGLTIHDEGVDGDLSGVFGAPTALVFGAGANTIIGSVGENGGTGASDGSDGDYLSIVIPAGFSLTSITIDSYSWSGASAGNRSFIATVAASSFTGQAGGDIDDFDLFNATSGDIIGGLGGPFGPGDQSFWIQETAVGVADYTITFTLVPEPFAGVLLLAGLVGLAGRRR